MSILSNLEFFCQDESHHLQHDSADLRKHLKSIPNLALTLPHQFLYKSDNSSELVDSYLLRPYWVTLIPPSHWELAGSLYFRLEMLFLSSQNNIHLFFIVTGDVFLFLWNLSHHELLQFTWESKLKICVPHKWLKRSHLILQDRKSQAVMWMIYLKVSGLASKYIQFNISVSSICMHATRWDHMWAHLCRTPPGHSSLGW